MTASCWNTEPVKTANLSQLNLADYFIITADCNNESSHLCFCHKIWHYNYRHSICNSAPLSLHTSFFEQTFFPEHMVAWCQETNHAILPSQLLQVRTAHTRCSLTALLNTQTVSFSESAPATYILYNQAGIPHLWPLDSVSRQSLQ